jgi:hypothetical protein
MLNDIVIHVGLDPLGDLVAMLNGNSGGTERIAEGIYQIGHFNFNHVLEASGYRLEEYPKDLVDSGVDDDPFGWGFSPYGVCDDPQQILDRCPTLQSPDRDFVISVTPILKENQEKHGGWRWHKWGEYIGVHEITSEYLYDEPVVEKVYCYHIYEIIE